MLGKILLTLRYSISADGCCFDSINVLYTVIRCGVTFNPASRHLTWKASTCACVTPFAVCDSRQGGAGKPNVSVEIDIKVPVTRPQRLYRFLSALSRKFRSHLTVFLAGVFHCQQTEGVRSGAQSSIVRTKKEPPSSDGPIIEEQNRCCLTLRLATAILIPTRPSGQILISFSFCGLGCPARIRWQNLASKQHTNVATTI